MAAKTSLAYLNKAQPVSIFIYFILFFFSDLKKNKNKKKNMPNRYLVNYKKEGRSKKRFKGSGKKRDKQRNKTRKMLGPSESSFALK